jgi:glycosyltransferase involved in cell wall biosynthesis
MYEAINKGLKIASGNILAYLNSDDLYFPDTFQTVVDYLQKHSATYLIYGNCDYIDADEALLYSYRYPNFNWKRFVAFKWSSIPQPASFWRSAVHLEIGYFDPTFKMAGDFEFFIRVGQYFKIDHLSKTLAMVRLHKKSLISLHQDKNRKEIYIIHQRYGVSPGIVTISRRWIVELQFKLLNLPLMIKKSIWKLWHLCRLFAK